MTLKELYNKLIESYSGENLNLITGKLIELYRGRQYSAIREIANKISDYVTIDEEQDIKCFSKLIILYHPDKGESTKAILKSLFQQAAYDQLMSYTHIFKILDIIDRVEVKIEADIDYNPEYVWDQYNDNSEPFDPDYSDSESEHAYTDTSRSFYNAIKLREYGRLDIEFPTYYLEDIESFELADQGIELLDGVQYCIHAKNLDLSNNLIEDLYDLWKLTNIEELYLANNQISFIDHLSNLINLRIIDLSGNQINDITPLLNLENLEFVNLIGNDISKIQIDQLRKKDIIVMY